MMEFIRLSGAGNTFLFFDLDQRPLPPENRSDLARTVCQNFHGFVNDGMVFMSKSAEANDLWSWDFYNSDGSPAEMCGNAARCVGRYLQSKGYVGPFRLQTQAGLLEIDFEDEESVRVKMPALKSPGEFVQLLTKNRNEEFFFVNSGVPHVVIEEEPNEDRARTLRSAKELGPGGANVTFYNEVTPGEIEAVTFERGVENFTMACGTGAVAAAAFAKERNPLLKNFVVRMPGGELGVSWITTLQPLLTGPAEQDFVVRLEESRT